MKKGKSAGPGIISQLLRKQKNKCAICKCSLDSNAFHVDHKKPFSLGGADSYSNYQLLCIPCHGEKTFRETGRKNLLNKKGYREACSRCGKVIQGINEKQVKALIKSHMLSKKCSLYKIRQKEEQDSSDEKKNVAEAGEGKKSSPALSVDNLNQKEVKNANRTRHRNWKHRP